MIDQDAGPTPALKICLIAGEASGDLIGGRLIESLKNKAPYPISFCGIGGESMKKAGLSSLFPMTDLSIMGLVEIIPHIPRLLKRLSETTAMIMAEKPDIVVTIDAPGFSFRLAKRLKKKGITLIHYTAPTVWAWRPKRAKKMAQIYDHLLCLFPFEPPYFTSWGLNTTYVGHPLLDQPFDRKGNKAALPPSPHQICLLPGSRRAEVKTLLPIFLQALRRLDKKYPHLSYVLPTLPHLTPIVMDIIKKAENPVNITVIDDRQRGMIALQNSTAALAASGTVSLELALWRIPMVIAYRVSPFTEMILRILIKTPYVSLVNILENQEIVPELLQKNCTGHRLADALDPLLHLTEIRNRQLDGFEKMYKNLTKTLENQCRPSDRAADVILSYIL